MRRQEAIDRLRSAEHDFKALGVANLYLFGSVSRDEAGDASDVDVFVDGQSAEFYTLTNYLAVYRRLQMAFPGFDLSYSTREGLSKHVRQEVEDIAIRVF